MQEQELLRIRKEKGLAIASTKKVRREGKYWVVPSQNRKAEYRVELTIAEVTCINEILLKVLCHNIIVLLSESKELGIEESFFGA